MNKKIITIILVLIVSSIVFAGAITIGQTFNQTEFNQVNIDELDFNMSIINTWVENDRLFVEFEYNTYNFNNDSNTYNTITSKGKIPYYLGFYRKCRDTNSIKECNNEIKDFVYNTAEEFRTKEKVKLEKWKTKELINEVNPFDFKSLYINYPLYKPNHSYEISDLLVYNNKLYKVVQAHTSQETWEPNQTPSLYKVHVLVSNKK